MLIIDGILINDCTPGKLESTTVGLLRRTATLRSVEGEKPGKALPDETPGLDHPLAASRPGQVNTPVAVAHLGSLGCLRRSTGGYARNRPKTARRSNSASCDSRKLLIRWSSLPDSNRCTSVRASACGWLDSLAESRKNRSLTPLSAMHPPGRLR